MSRGVGSRNTPTSLRRAQARTWADLLEVALPAALQEAAAQEVALRRATPVDFTECARDQTKLV